MLPTKKITNVHLIYINECENEIKKIIINSNYSEIMSEEKSSILFNKNSGEQCQEDIWDDTALIRAYEKSVKIIRKKIDAKLVITDKRETNKFVKCKEKKEESDDGEYDECEGTGLLILFEFW